MKGLEFAIIDNGHGENDAGYVYCGYQFGDVTDKYRKRAWMQFPLFCVLIKHPTEGYIMYDVGPRIGDESNRRPESVTRTHPAFIKKEEFVGERLKQLGLSVDDISTIIISHFHWDHIGGLEQFKGTKAIENIYAPEKDFAAGLVATHRTSKTELKLGQIGAVHYFREDFEVEGAEFNLIDEDMEFAPGIDFVIFEGHTPAVLGLMLHLESGTYIFPSDSVNAAINYGPPIVYPGIIYDTLGVVRTTKKLRKLEKQYDAKIIFPHDPWQYPNLHKAPYFYK